MHLSGLAYLAALSLAAGVSLRRPSWPMRLMLAAWAASELLMVTRDPARDAIWLPTVWMPVEAFSLAASALCFTWMIARETRHREALNRLLLRWGVGLMAVALAGIPWVYGSHYTTLYWRFLTARSHFWQAWGIAYLIAWANTWRGRRFTADGLLCFGAAAIHGVASSLSPLVADAALKTACYRLTMTALLAWWITRGAEWRSPQREVRCWPTRPI